MVREKNPRNPKPLQTTWGPQPESLGKWKPDMNQLDMGLAVGGTKKVFSCPVCMGFIFSIQAACAPHSRRWSSHPHAPRSASATSIVGRSREAVGKKQQLVGGFNSLEKDEYTAGPVRFWGGSIIWDSIKRFFKGRPCWTRVIIRGPDLHRRTVPQIPGSDDSQQNNPTRVRVRGKYPQPKRQSCQGTS